MRSSEINERLAALAAKNHGVITTAQARSLGVNADALRRRVTSGSLQHLDESVYVVSGAPDTWSRRALVAAHISGEHASLSHRCAASLWGMEGFATAPLELTVTRWARRARRSGVIVHESTDLDPVDRTTRAGLPVTTVVRTLLDLAAVSHAHRLEQAMEDAFRRHLCTPDELLRRYRRARPTREAGLRQVAGDPRGSRRRRRAHADRSSNVGPTDSFARCPCRGLCSNIPSRSGTRRCTWTSRGPNGGSPSNAMASSHTGPTRRLPGTTIARPSWCSSDGTYSERAGRSSLGVPR